MQKTLLHLIIQLLVAAIVGLGIAQAGGDLCPPDCSHCGVAAVASSCCENVSADEVAAPVPDNTGPQPDCDYGSYCDAIDAKSTVLSVHRAADTDCTAIAPAGVVLVAELPVRYHSFSLKSPPQERQPALYTLHCSLLI